MGKVGCGGYLRLLLALCLALTLVFTGCVTDPVGVAVDHGDITLILPADFMDLSGESFAAGMDFLYGRNSLIVKGLSEKKSALQAMTLAEYTAYVISGNKITCSPVVFGDGYLFTYETAIGQTLYTYTTATYEGQDNFWIFQFYCPTIDLAENQPEIDIILEGIQPKKG